MATVRTYACATKPLDPKPRYAGLFIPEEVPAFAYLTYDCVPPSPDAELTDLDLLVINGLNGRADASVFARLRSFAKRAADALEQAHWLQPDFREFGREELGNDPHEGSAGYWLACAWRHGVATPDLGVARVHKVLHHKRPRLFPLLDRRTLAVIGPAAQDAGCTSWQLIHDDLHANREGFDRLEDQFAKIANDVGGVRLSPLRLHDILIWMDALGYRRA